MSAENLIASFLRIAKEDLDGAKVLAPQGNRNAIYLCEQAAEKVIRAVLTSEGLHAGVGHDLEAMVDQVPDLNPLKPLLRAVEELTTYATTFRYPDRREQIPKTPDASKIAGFLQKAEDALTEAAKRFGVDLMHKTSPATNKNPIR